VATGSKSTEISFHCAVLLELLARLASHIEWLQIFVLLRGDPVWLGRIVLEGEKRVLSTFAREQYDMMAEHLTENINSGR
jgi:hypothetical protein